MSRNRILRYRNPHSTILFSSLNCTTGISYLFSYPCFIPHPDLGHLSIVLNPLLRSAQHAGSITILPSHFGHGLSLIFTGLFHFLLGLGRRLKILFFIIMRISFLFWHSYHLATAHFILLFFLLGIFPLDIQRAL